MQRILDLARDKAASTALIIGVFTFWEVFCLAANISDILLPRPTQIIAPLIKFWPAIWPHTYQTLYTTLVGFGFGVAIGVAIGVLIGSSRLTVPAILTAMIICIFPIVVNVATGIATVEPELEDVMKTLKASKLDILWNVSLPRAMPYFFASLKVAIALAFVGSVVAETVASNRGIGNMMMIASSSFNVPLVFAGLFVLAGLGVSLYAIFSLIEHRVTGWAHRKTDLAAS